MITEYINKIEDKINALEHRIAIDVHMAETYKNWDTYYTYIENNLKELEILKKALKIKNKLENANDEDF